MATNDRKLLLDKIEAAKRYLNAAELELDGLMGEIPAEPRAQKTTVSQVVQSMFEKLREAKSDVSQLETLLSESDE